MKKLLVIILSCFITFFATAQKFSIEQYIQQYKDIAIIEMKRMGIPAAITLAQGILESENGNSDLVKKSNNHFGIKCKNTWTGGTVSHDDDASAECFRSYLTAQESFRDHSNFLRGNTRYNFLFDLDAADYRSWAYGLKKAGYATNPEYPGILIKNIEQYNLQQYTLSAVNDIPKFDASKYDNDTQDSVKTFTDKKNADSTSDKAIVSILDIPDKIITINKSTCVFAKKGTSFLLIAAKNNIELNTLLECNELAEDAILGKSQYVYLQKKQKTGEPEFCIVQPGETIYDIAQLYGIQLQYLLDYNKLNNGAVVSAGTKLLLHPLRRAEKEKNQSSKTKMHQVVAKEGLYGIAKKYNVTVDQLKKWNDLSDDELKIGQQLIIAK